MGDRKTAKLCDVCQIKPPKKQARQLLTADTPVSFVPMSNLGVLRKRLVLDQDRALGEVAGSYTYFADGDVLLAKITPCFENGKLGIARQLTNGVGFGSSEFVVLRPTGGLQSDYLFYFLSQDSFRDAGKRVMAGAVGHKRVPKEFVAQCQIPLPPLPEQERIVAILDEAFAAIATATANAEKDLANARELFESERDAALWGVDDGWNESDLGELVTIKHGFAFRSDGFVEHSGHVLLTPGNFYEQGGYRDRGAKQKYYAGDIPDGFVLAPGDLLVAMTEQAAGLLGSPLIVPESGRFLHNQRLGLVEPLPDVPWCSEFFLHVFNTRRFRAAVHRDASGVKVRHTSPKRMSCVRVRYPRTLSAQESVATRLDSLHDLCLAVESRCRRKVACLAELKQSILHKAFTGELTAKPHQLELDL